MTRRRKKDANPHITELRRRYGIFLWEIGLELGISELAVIRKLRVPLDTEDNIRFTDAINAIARREHLMDGEKAES